MSSTTRLEIWGQTGVLLSCLLLVGISVFAAWKETNLFFRTGASPVERVLGMTDASNVALSTDAQQSALFDCTTALGRFYSLELRYLPEPDRQTLSSRCLELADATTTSSPAMSFAWYVGALAASTQDNMQGMNDRLVRSQITGDTEQWVADARVALSETYLDDLTEAARESHTLDLTMMVQSAAGLSSLAQRYIRDENFRDRITVLVETMPDTVQRRFLRNLRWAVQSAQR